MIPVFVVVARSLSTVVCIDANPAENKGELELGVVI